MIKNLEHLLATKLKPIRVIYISSYIPRYCGIATYTKDLTNAINLLNPYAQAEIMVMNRETEKLSYPWEVKYKIEQEDLSTYLRAAEYINQSGADLVCLEHEFGLFGGKNGEYILPFIESLKIPLVTTLHTVLEDASSAEGTMLKRIIKQSVAVTVMLEKVKLKLKKDYAVPDEKIVAIPHGTPDLPFTETDKYKKKKKLSGRILLGNANLLHPVKGVEYALEAVAEIAKKYPNVLYFVIGQTHPVYQATFGETYRNSLKKLVKKLKIEKHVRFVNEYLSLSELVEWLRTLDFYITPYLDPDQAASGGLAYAVGAGKCCISTPYLYAKEILSDGRGVLVPFKDSKSIANAVIDLWENQSKKTAMEKKAYQYGRLMTWSNVAFQYLELFRTVLNAEVVNHKMKNNKDIYPSTSFSLTHIERMTDTIGMLEHCIFSIPDRIEGYATDDNARALQVMLRLNKFSPVEYIEKYSSIYLKFLFSARCPKGFHQDLNADLTWKDDVGLDDGFGRAMSALAEAAVTAPTIDQQLAAVLVFDQQAVLIKKVKHARVAAQIITALSYRLQFETTKLELMPLLLMRKKLKKDMPIDLPINIQTEIINLADKLEASYLEHSSQSWHWYEDILSYDNGRLPLGMLYAYQITGNKKYLTIALKSLDFLLDQTYDNKKDCFSFPGYRGWLVRGKKKALYGQQPIEAGSTVEVCVLAYEVTGVKKYLDFAFKALEWYSGRNILNIDILNTDTAGVKDGLEEWGVNPNEGAESILSYALACLALKKYKK